MENSKNNFPLGEDGENVDQVHGNRFVGSIVVAARSGGKGKTTTAQVIAHQLRSTDISVDIYSLDASTDESVSKLRHVLPETKDLRFGASMKDVVENPAAALDHFDEIGAIMSKGGALFDFGANVAPVFFGWAAVSGLSEIHGEIPPLTLVIPVTASSVSIADAAEIIADARKSIDELPVKKVIVVYNERDGGFSSQVAGYDDLKRLEKGRDANFEITSIVMPLLPKINATFWNNIEIHEMSYRAVLEMNAEALTKKLDMVGMTAARGKIALKKWLDTVVQAFTDVGLTS